MSEMKKRQAQTLRRLRAGLRAIATSWATLTFLSPETEALYLWIFRPDAARLGALSKVLSLLPGRASEIPDFHQLELGLRWLAVFDRQGIPRVEQALHRLRPFSAASSTRGAEEEFLHFLEQLRTGAGGALLESPDEAPGTSLEDQLLHSLLQALAGPRSPARGEVQVDLRTFELASGSTRTRSRALCLAIELLRLDPSVTFEQFQSHVFGAAAFDPFLHEVRIRNLLNRIKKISVPGGVKIQTKEHRIYCSADWSRFRFLRPSPHEAIRSCVAWKKLLLGDAGDPISHRRPHTVSVDAARKSFPDVFTRSQFERALGLSRSTAGRRLFSWRERGLLTLSSAGPRTGYRFVSQPRAELKSPAKTSDEE